MIAIALAGPFLALGFLVTVGEFSVGMPRDLRALPTKGRASGPTSDRTRPQL